MKSLRKIQSNIVIFHLPTRSNIPGSSIQQSRNQEIRIRADFKSLEAQTDDESADAKSSKGSVLAKREWLQPHTYIVNHGMNVYLYPHRLKT
jgi:hypothetical protein